MAKVLSGNVLAYDVFSTSVAIAKYGITYHCSLFPCTHVISCFGHV